MKTAVCLGPHLFFFSKEVSDGLHLFNRNKHGTNFHILKHTILSHLLVVSTNWLISQIQMPQLQDQAVCRQWMKEWMRAWAIHHCRLVGLYVTWWPCGHGLSFSFVERDLSYMLWVCMKHDFAVAKSCLHLTTVTAANDL